MKSLSVISLNQPLHYWGIRIVLCVVAMLIYLMLWRPVRVWITERVVAPQVTYLEDRQEAFESVVESGALLIQYEYGDGSKELQYRPQFGFFFLVALLGLFFVASHGTPYWALLLLHLIGTVLVYLSVIAGAIGFLPGFILADAVSGYMIPALSLGLVPLAVKGFVGEGGLSN